ncbi:N-acetylneuraminate synthase family protein, partial [Candidatus Altiarchaeota archaeon]
GGEETQYEMLKRLQLDYRDFPKLKGYCDRKGIIFLSTPHTFDAIDFLEDMVPSYKFGSGDLTNIPALEHAASKGKPMMLGTGMSTLSEVREAVGVIRKQGNDRIVALHCTTDYPCPPEDVNLRAMKTMMRELDCLVGYSDHTLGIIVPVAAASLGSTVIEKHFTLDKSMQGPDHKASLEPDELREMVGSIRAVETILGSGEKRPTESEKAIMGIVRKSIASSCDIPKGTTITSDMLAVKRPGTGIPPKDINKVVGKKAKKTIKCDHMIRPGDVG